MDITCERTALLAAVAAAGGAVERRNTLAILSCLRLRTGAGGLEVTAANLDLHVTIPAPASVSAPGDRCVSASALADWLKVMPAGAQVRLRADGDRIIATCGRSRATLPALPGEDLPTIPPGNPASLTRLDLDGRDLLAAITWLLPVTSREETRAYLCGIHIHHTDCGPAGVRGGLTLVATDGARLGIHVLDAPAVDGALPDIILHHAGAALLGKLLDGAPGPVALEVSETHLRATLAGGASLTTKLIDGTYPAYQRVVPPPSGTAARVDAAEALAALRRATATARTGGARVGWMAGGEDLTIQGDPLGSGQWGSEDSCPCQVGGGDYEAGFNPAYLAEALAAYGAEEVLIDAADAATPARIQVPGDDRRLRIVMPMRV